MEELKSRILEVAKEFKRVCDKNNLRYCLAFGTFLGAVRHKGFIPWDDDIDFHMPRPDYDKFLEICKDELNPRFALRTLKEDKYIYEFAKIDDTKTTLVESFNKSNGFKGGVYIDIFPLEAMPNDKKDRDKFMKKLVRTKFIASWGLVDFSSKKYPWYKQLIINFGKYVDGKKYLLKFDNLIRSNNYNESNYVLTTIAPPRTILEKSLFNDLVDYEFEDTTFKGIRNYDKYLSEIYGDYMTLPPVDERKSVHYIDLLDLNKPYNE